MLGEPNASQYSSSQEHKSLFWWIINSLKISESSSLQVERNNDREVAFPSRPEHYIYSAITEVICRLDKYRIHMMAADIRV